MNANDVVARIDEVGVRFRHFTLGPVTADLLEGCTALLGTNGAGKTTLMRSMLGLQPSASGHLALGDLRSDRRGDRRSFARAVGWSPQRPEFPRFVTVRQCLDYAADLKGLSRRDAAAAIEEAARSTDLVDRLDHGAARLSGGQQQRLAIAQAIIHRPRLLVLDEPTAGLDPVQRLEFRHWLEGFAVDHAVLISTHMIEDVRAVSDRVLVLHDGRMVFSGTTQSLLDEVAEGDGSLDQAVALFLRRASG